MTEPSGWLGTGITIISFLIGGGVFVGVIRTSINALTKSVLRLEHRMDTADGHIGRGDVQGAEHSARLLVAEKEAGAALKGFHALAERIASFQAETARDHQYTREKLEELARGQESHSRQLATLARNGAAFYDLGAPK